MDHDQSQVSAAKSRARRTQQRPAPGVFIASDEQASCMKHSTWRKWLASAFMSKRSLVRGRLLASRAGNFVEGLRAPREGRAVASIYGIFCWPLQCPHNFLATAAAAWFIAASPFNCATLTEGSSATPTPLPGCPVAPPGTAPPHHCWSCHAVSAFAILRCATCYKAARWRSSQLLWAPGFGGQLFGQHQHLHPKCTDYPGHSSSSLAAVLIVCSSSSALFMQHAKGAASWLASGRCQGRPAVNVGAGASLLQTSTLRGLW